ncbi:MAG: succinyl-diaminopimelate desuccinylase, partial [Gammaproteobacteria bacterium]
SINGTRKVVEYLEEQNIKINWCLVGEPSSKKTLGDVIKNGRRGSLGAKLTVFGIQGHVAYPHLARNPIHLFAPALAELSSMRWDDGNEFYPPTSFQVSNLNAGTGADNVIPGHLEVMFNFRFSTEVTQAELEQKVEEILARHQLEYDIEWKLSGQPFVTTKGELLNAVIHAVKETIGVEPEVSTGGGTSDGRFIAPTGAQIVELGPVNATIHKLNECVKADDLDTLSSTYENILQRLFC